MSPQDTPPVVIGFQFRWQLGGTALTSIRCEECLVIGGTWLRLKTMDIESGVVDVARSEFVDENNSKVIARPNDSELRVLIFTACYFVLDGVTLTIRRLESHLRSKGAIVKILTTVPDDMDKEQIQDLIVLPGIKIPFTNAGDGYAFGGGLDPNTTRLIEEFNPNVIHFTVPDLVGLDGIRWCQRNNVAYIATWHSNYCDYLKYYFLEWILKPAFLRYLQGFYEQIPVVYVPTPFILNKMESEGFGKSTELREWGRGVDLKLFSPERRSNEFRSSRGISEHDVVVLWVGRLVPEKRPDIWTEVLQRLESEGISCKGMVVGHGTYEATLSQMHNVICCGWLSGVHLAEAYASADILLFPSDVETFGNVTLEALAAGCPSIVESTCSGHLVEHGYNGYTCPAGDFEHFYQATKNLVQDDKLRKEMSQHARQSAWKYERNKILQQMSENYKDAIVRHRNPDYIVDRMKSSPEAAGRNMISFLCCNYWIIKHYAEPILNTTSGMQNLTQNSLECVQRSRLNCCAAMESRRSDERKNRMISAATILFFGRAAYFMAFLFSYLIIGLFVYASFTV